MLYTNVSLFITCHNAKFHEFNNKGLCYQHEAECKSVFLVAVILVSWWSGGGFKSYS